MRLSEAIRLGAMLKPQAFDGEAGNSSCALRAAAEAAGIEDEDLCGRSVVNYVEFYNRYSYLKRHSACPACEHYHSEALAVIYHLNDTHHWTRERIADWVETIEPKEVEAPVAARELVGA